LSDAHGISYPLVYVDGANVVAISFDVGFEVSTAVVMKNINFWDITPCSPLSVKLRFGGTYRLHFQGRRNKFKKQASKQAEISAYRLLACWFLAVPISSILKMEAICSSETSVYTQRTTWRYIPGVNTLHFFRYSLQSLWCIARCRRSKSPQRFGEPPASFRVNSFLLLH
jgi:hypothetical protein